MIRGKIFVWKLKDLIRVGAIVLVGLALIITALVLLIPGRGGEPAEPAARFTPGTYEATIILTGEPVHVRVVVDYDEILEIYMTDLREVQRTFYPLFEPRMRDLATEILHYQSAYITPATDYPVTTGILHRAVMAALRDAKN